jgi:diguanylate cyclase (GGDEF)-like protein/PAS domain S-box-containing protein
MALLPPLPPFENERLDALRRLELLDSDADPAYEALAQLAARLFGTPVAAIGLMEAEHQWIKAGVGVVHGETFARDSTFCAHTIAGDTSPWIVGDAARDPRFADHPDVVSGRVGFYAGAPVTAKGHRIGTLCVAGPEPREIDEEQRALLLTLAAAVSAHVEARRQHMLANERHGALVEILENAPDAFMRLDDEGNVLAFNARAEELFGWDRDVIAGRPLLDTLVPDSLRTDEARALAAAVLAGEARLPEGPVEVPARHADGHNIAIELTMAATTSTRGIRFNIFARDITERLERERERREETEALAVLADVTSRLARGLDDVLLRDQLCEAAATIAGAANAALFVPHPDGGLQATGASEPSLRGLVIAADAHSLTLEAFRTGTPHYEADAAATGWSLAARHQGRSVATQPVILDGRCIGVLAVYWTTVRPELGVRTGRLLGLLVHEASTAFARTALFARLAEQSRTDALTGVLNRRALDDELHLAMLNARRDDTRLSVAVLDLDHFKAYNDGHGHSAGDALLKGACASWSAMLRSGDVLARFGGEEFVVVLPGCATSDAHALVDRLRGETPGGQTCSAGVATWDGKEAVGDLIVRADRALYRAKDQGRDMVCLA